MYVLIAKSSKVRLVITGLNYPKVPYLTSMEFLKKEKRKK